MSGTGARARVQNWIFQLLLGEAATARLEMGDVRNVSFRGGPVGLVLPGSFLAQASPWYRSDVALADLHP